MSRRWPLHPLPFSNESLLSWMIRIANLYDMEPKDLLMYEFGINLEVHDLYSIDLNPPMNLLNQLSECAGIEFNVIRGLTAQSYVPLLIDSIEDSEAQVFNDYTNQFNIFPGKRKNITDLNNSWVPWFNINRFATAQGCEICLSEDPEPYLRLHWRFPWMMSCPIHKLLLEQVIFYRSQEQKIGFFFSKNNNANVGHTLDHLWAMDNITLQAVTKGVVEVPSGTIHGGVWLRILSLIEELSSPIRIIGSKTRELMLPFWQELNLFVREGLGKYTLFEQCDYNKQLRLMLVAALVFRAIFSKEIKFSGTIVSFLTPLPICENDLCSVYQDPTISKPLIIGQEHEGSDISAFEKFCRCIDKLIIVMRSDPEAVKSLRSFIMAYDRAGTRLPEVDKCLIELGINIDTSK